MRKGLLIAVLVLLVGLIAPSGCKAPPEAPPPSPAPPPTAKFEVTSLDITPPEVRVGETVNIAAQVRNTGASEGTYMAVLTVNRAEVERKDVTVAAGATETVTFTLVKNAPGTYQIAVGEQSSTLTVKEKPIAKFSDSTGDLFDKAGNPAAAEPYLDIIETELSLSDEYYSAKIKVNGPLPTRIDNPAGVIEWDIMIDSDCDPGTGWHSPLLFNDIGLDYYLCVGLTKSGYGVSAQNVKTHTCGSIEYKIEGDIVKLHFSSETIGKPVNFNFVVAVKKFGERGAPQALQVADKAPNEGHYVFPDHHAYVQPGLPTAYLESEHATVYYNLGNEDRAEWYAEAFEHAYTEVGNELGAYPAQRFKLYVYVTQEDLVTGLQTFSGFSPQAAAFFKSGGAPRPINYVMHVCPGSTWHDMAHEYTHTIIEEISGRVFLSIKWLDEGLAEYVAYNTISKTKYREGEQAWRTSRMGVVRKALDEGKLFALKDISTGEQWHSRMWTAEGNLQYAEAYAVVTYLAQTYGIDKCKAILQLMKEGSSQEVAVQQALGISLAQFEMNFKANLLHEDAWSKLVSQAEDDIYLKYAIYAFRTLAVKHPEIYLQGDNILAEVLTINRGSKEAYEIKDVHSDYFYKPWKQGASFSFDDVDFSKYKLVGCRDLYLPNYPFLSFLDRRLDLLTTTLKTFDDRITRLEKAEQLYFTEKKKGYKELYLIYCDNENAYLYRDGALISAKEQKEVEQPKGNPILIFNEDNVWYPLMGRDDTSKNRVLSELVAKYSTKVKEPKLSDFENDLIPQLKKVTEFIDIRSLTFLKLACINASVRIPSLLSQEMKQEFGKLNLTWWNWCDRALNEKMSLFSPISAYLAAIGKQEDGRTRIEALCNEYGKHTRTPGYKWSHGHIWSCAVVEYGIEHAYRTHAGHCVVQSAAIGAALELAGINRYRLQGFAPADSKVIGHDFIYVPQYDLIISNGIIENIRNTVIWHTRNGIELKYIDFVEHDGKWAYLWRTPTCSLFYGTLSPNETIEILEHLRGIHNDDIQGRRWEKGKFIKLPFEQLKQQLVKEQEHWQPYELPPYGIP